MNNLWRDYRWRRPLRFWGPVVAILLLSVMTSAIVWTIVTRNESIEQRAERLADLGDPESAELLYWQMLQKNPNDIRSWIVFIDSHAFMTAGDDDEPSEAANEVPHQTIPESKITNLLQRIGNRDTAIIASFWYAVRVRNQKGNATPVESLADRQPPPRYANYILGRIAWDDGKKVDAAHRFEKEALAFPKSGRRNLRRVIDVFIDGNMWDEVRKRVHDPRYGSVVDARLRLDLAEHDRDWPAVLLWIWPASFVDSEPWPIALAIISALLWFTIAGRLGHFNAEDNVRRRLYLSAFLLGILSVYPTLLAISIEETVLGFKEVGVLVPDAIYFVFGVGLREELAKLLLFLPLLPVLKRRGSRIEAMTCGALVGLGFAAEENVQYFAHLGAAMAIGRFLTANFFHMGLTSLVALSVYDTARGKQTSRDGFNVVFPLAVGLHGAYDLLLSAREFAGLSFVAMILLIVVARVFLRQLLIASTSVQQQGLVRLFVWSLTFLTGISYVYATTLVGPFMALRLVFVGVLGVAILIFVFVRELGTA